jgi:hypothetical protein
MADRQIAGYRPALALQDLNGVAPGERPALRTAGFIGRSKEGFEMKFSEIQGRAKKMGVNPVGKTKTDLVRSVQKAEHNRDCYNRGESAACGQAAWAWREECK